MPEIEQQVQAALYEKDLRDHHGHDIAHCTDPEFTFYPQRQICRADMERAAAEWRYDQLHEAAPYHDGSFKNWSEKRTLRYPYHYRDGVEIVVAETDLYPDDDFLEARQAESPI